ncbi:MAG: SdrD B-like domain-containing protein [Candidatus Omnitrophota bacterium]|jgi:hypothetical protein
MRLKKIFILVMVLVFLCTENLPAFAYVMMPEYLCELGLDFYHQGKYGEALHEFRKALIIKPGYEPALKYIDMIQQEMPTTPLDAVPAVYRPPTVERPLIIEPKIKSRQAAIKEVLDRMEESVYLPVGLPELIEEKIALPKVLLLDENINRLQFPLEIEIEKSIIIRGINIKRFLATQPDVLDIERINQNDILVTAHDFGHTYLHIWDAQARWTLEFLTTPARPPGPTYEELRRKEEERARNFKLRHSVDWSCFETGRRVDELDRVTYSWRHWLNLTGSTPYGNLDSALSVSSLKRSTDLTYFSLGLEEGRFGPFEDFSIRTFDYSSGIANLAFSGADLRGVMLKSPAFDKKLDYTVFWAREGGGRYGGLSPGLVKTKHSFLSGFDLNYSPVQRQNYNFSVFRGWGRDRPDDLNPYAYDLDIDYRFANWGWGYEVAFDSETFAHLLNLNYSSPKLRLTSELRDTAKNFRTMTGWGWRIGELGLLTNLFYQPTDNLSIASYLDVFQDRLYPNPKDENRWNEHFNWDAVYRINPLTSLRLDFRFQNELGRLSPYRAYSEGISLYRTFEYIRRINTFLNYQHQESKHYTSPSGDYINDKIVLGLRLSIIGDLYYFLNKEFNWTEARYTGESVFSQALNTGIDWYGQLLNSPLWARMRFVFRDEEDATSAFSFLSGEDYIEGYAEISYRPKPDIEAFLSARVRNVWAENPSVNKRVEANFYAGLRYLWDTGIRWESIGTIEGYVFKDFNDDGLMEAGELPVEGVRIWLGKDKSQITDEYGYYTFKKVKATKAYVNIDAKTIPSGFTLTVPATQEAVISHKRSTRIDFGITSRTEIMGVVFEDIDQDGQLGPYDSGIKGVVLLLEDGSKTTTNATGRYYFRKATVGEHTVTLDLNSLPTEYIPAVPIFRDVELFEGTSYHYNIPLRKVK